MAAVAGLGVSALYYTQPMLAVMALDLRAAPATLATVPMLTQLGYAAGILLLAPLGDRIDRRRIILTKAGTLAVTLAVAALAQSITVMSIASFVLGLAATLAQDVVSSAATLAPERSRGRVVGSVMTGLLLGILLSRTVSGLVAQYFGWRAMLGLAALGMAAAMAPVWHLLPVMQVTTRLGYGELLRSLGGLWRRHPALRRAAWAQALLAVGFSAFWSSLAVMLSGEPFRLGSAVAGAFGLAGAVGALAAPLAGRLADKHGPVWVTRLCSALAVASFAGMLGACWLEPHAQLVALAVAVVGFDLGVQATLIGHQTIVYGLDPDARSRLNAVLIAAMFAGMSFGAGLGGVLLETSGWAGVMGLATASAAGAFGLRLRAPERELA
jgi:predicted MFS family arabinose efflux permease